MPKAYGLIFGQCTKNVLSKLEAHKYFQKMMGGYDMLILVVAIKGLTFKFGGHNHPPYTLHEAKRDFYRYYQTGHTTNQQYLEILKNNISLVYSYGGAIRTDP